MLEEICLLHRHQQGVILSAERKQLLERRGPTTQKPYLDADYYVQLVNFESDDFTSATAKTIHEAQKLVETGF
jgi:hypothetical protein